MLEREANSNQQTSNLGNLLIPIAGGNKNVDNTLQIYCFCVFNTKS